MSGNNKSCSQQSLESGEQLFGTAPQVDNWFLLEYSGNWSKDAFLNSQVPENVKQYIKHLLDSFENSRLQLIKSVNNSSEGIAFYHAVSSEFEPKLYRFSLNSYEDIVNLDIQKLIETGEIRDSECDEKIVLVCTHGNYDSCCGTNGVPVYESIRDRTDVSVWSTTHVGAHRFAANTVMLPEGIYYGRVNKENINTLLSSHINGDIYLDCFRGRSCFSQTSQVSDYFLREKKQIFGIYEIGWEYEKDNYAYTAVEFRHFPEKTVYSINTVVMNDFVKVYPSCGDTEPKHLPFFFFYSLIPYVRNDEES